MHNKNKNINVKTIKYTKNLSQTKINYTDTNRIKQSSGNTNTTNINDRKPMSPTSKHIHSSSNISNYLHKGNQIINNIFRNQSPSQCITSLYSLHKQNKELNNNININNNQYQGTKTTPNSPNNIKCKTKTQKYIHKYNRNNRQYITTNPSFNSYFKTKNPSVIIPTNPNSALRSSTSSFSQGSKGNNVNTTSTNNNKPNKTKGKYLSQKSQSKLNNINVYLHLSSYKSHDFLSAQLSPSSSINKMRNIDSSSSNNGIINTNINQLSTKENSISLNNKVKNTLKTSLYTDYCTHTIKDIQDIETPEELHFLYVTVIQSGKLVEVKFENSMSNIYN